MLEFCSDKYCDNIKDVYCKHERSKRLHKLSEFYKKLHEETQFVSNLQSDNEKEKEDAHIL